MNSTSRQENMQAWEIESQKKNFKNVWWLYMNLEICSIMQFFHVDLMFFCWIMRLYAVSSAELPHETYFVASCVFM